MHPTSPDTVAKVFRSCKELVSGRLARQRQCDVIVVSNAQLTIGGSHGGTRVANCFCLHVLFTFRRSVLWVAEQQDHIPGDERMVRFGQILGGYEDRQVQMRLNH